MSKSKDKKGRSVMMFKPCEKDKFKIEASDVHIDESLNHAFTRVCFGSWKQKSVAIKLDVEKHERNIILELLGLSESSDSILIIYGYIKDNLSIKLVMEHMDRDLYNYIFGFGNTKPDLVELGQIALDIANGIKFLHKHGFVHGDIKLDNIMLKAKRAKLVDFDSTSTQNNPLIYMSGPINYFAPEILKLMLRDQLFSLTKSSDIFAFHVVLHVLFTKKYPYRDLDISETLKKIRIGPHFDNNIFDLAPPEIVWLIVAASMVNPQLRCNAETVVEELEDIMETLRSTCVEESEEIMETPRCACGII